jgi:hypothetical protein
VSGSGLLCFPPDPGRLVARVGADLLGDLLGGPQHPRYTVTKVGMARAALLPHVCAYGDAYLRLLPL